MRYYKLCRFNNENNTNVNKVVVKSEDYIYKCI